MKRLKNILWVLFGLAIAFVIGYFLFTIGQVK